MKKSKMLKPVKAWALCSPNDNCELEILPGLTYGKKFRGDLHKPNQWEKVTISAGWGPLPKRRKVKRG